MVAATRITSIRVLRCFCLLLASCWLMQANSAHAQQNNAIDGMFISVPTIHGNAKDEIEKKIHNALKRDRNIHVVVFDFNPNGANTSEQFGACHDLAVFIKKLRRGNIFANKTIKTYAFVHDTVSRHTVLPVLACKNILMSDEKRSRSDAYLATIGDVVPDGKTLSESETSAYDIFAKDLSSPDLARLMYTPGLVVKEVQNVQTLAKSYMSDATIAARKAAGDPIKVIGIPEGLEAGSSKLNPKQAVDYGLANSIHNTRDAIRRSLQLPRRSMMEDWLIGTPVAWRIEVRGQIDNARLASLKRRIERARGQGANLIILQLDCQGGETEGAPSFAKYLLELKDQNNTRHLKSVAYVPPDRKLGPGTFLALGCDEIMMASSAVLGDFNYLYNKTDAELKIIRDNLVALAKHHGHEPLLFRAMLEHDLKLYRVQSRNNANFYTVLTQEQWQKDQNSPNPQWHGASAIPIPDGEFLSLDAKLAGEWNVAPYNNVDTVAELYEKCNIDDPSRVNVSRDDWLDQVAEFFRHPVVNILLIMVGIVGLILELKLPGIGFPGILAAVCFVLFFWAYSFVGEFTVLAVLLFVLGLILIGIEVFVIPGFGITGVSGLLLVISSLVLVTMERVPQSSSDWVQLTGTLITFGGTIVAAVIVAILTAWYLPHIPYANRLVLSAPVDESDLESDQPTETEEKAAALLGAIGVTATTLRPAGKVRFGDEYLDVVAEGDYITPGKRVQVIEIEGNRIVVKGV